MIKTCQKQEALATLFAFSKAFLVFGLRPFLLLGISVFTLEVFLENCTKT